ncbi:hypothetical protein BsWGS_19020 [Bradybaena similaris]
MPCPRVSNAELLNRIYPYSTMLGKEGKEAVQQAMPVPAGTLDSATLKHESRFVNTDYHETVLSQMIQSHLVKDFCVIGVRPHLSTLEIGSCQENLRSSIQSELHEKIGGHPNSPAHRCGQSAFIYSSQLFI